MPQSDRVIAGTLAYWYAQSDCSSFLVYRVITLALAFWYTHRVIALALWYAHRVIAQAFWYKQSDYTSSSFLVYTQWLH